MRGSSVRPTARRIVPFMIKLSLMIRLLEQAIAAIRTLPNERQDEAATLLLNLVQDDPRSVRLGLGQVAEVERRLRDPSPYVTNEQVRGVRGLFRT